MEYHSDADYNSRRVGVVVVVVVVVHTFKNGLTFERLDRFASYLEGSCTRVSRFAAYAYVMIRPTQLAQPAYWLKGAYLKRAYLWHFSTDLIKICYGVSKWEDSTYVCDFYAFEHANWPNQPTTQPA